jgi:DNA-binding transcriptional ArsR family regulator
LSRRHAKTKWTVPGRREQSKAQRRTPGEPPPLPPSPPPLPTGTSQGVGDLYRARNDARRDEFLLSVASDVVVLNRVLRADPPLDLLVDELAELADATFADRKDLREPTLRKVMEISTTVAAMKQGFETLAMVYPYCWVEREAERLKNVFGPQLAARLVPAERRRMVPLVRRQVRTFQANLQRPLTEIEAALRPVEEIIARAGLQNHWASKLRRYLPGIAQGVLGASLVAMGAGAIGGRIVAGAVAMHGLGSILGHFESDRVAAALLRHSAVKAFQWWRILIASLSVSLYEAAEFVDGLSNQSMLRDRKIIDALPADTREKMLRRLRKGLREEYAVDHHRRSEAVAEDADITWMDLSEDMRAYMRDHLRSYVTTMSGRERATECSRAEEDDNG